MFKRLLVISAIFISFAAHSPEKLTAYFDKKELNCLLRNIYHEARGEPLKGQVAVAKVTLNRATNSSICDVVYAPSQFSWTLNKAIKHPAKFPAETLEAAHLALLSKFPATHYHTIYVKPYWAKQLKYITTINNHKFYYEQ